jgi:hypothetical protein
MMRSKSAAAAVALLLLLATSASAATCPAAGSTLGYLATAVVDSAGAVVGGTQTNAATCDFNAQIDPAAVPVVNNCHWQANCAAAEAWCTDATTNANNVLPADFKCAAGHQFAEFSCTRNGASDACFGNVPLGCDQLPVIGLDTAGDVLLDFAVLAGAKVSKTADTTTRMNGKLGLYPQALTLITGFSIIDAGIPGVGMSTYVTNVDTSADTTGRIHAADTPAFNAMAALLTAYNDAKGRTMCPAHAGKTTVDPAVDNTDLQAHLRTGELGQGLTLGPGLYFSTSGFEITGDLTLDAGGNAAAVFIFQMAATFTSADGTLTSPGSRVLLTNGAQAKNIFWQVGSSATLGKYSHLEGTIMADQSIVVFKGATVTGRVLARIAAVTLDANEITLPAL